MIQLPVTDRRRFRRTSTSSRAYGEQESVLEVGELSVALLAAVQPVVLVDDFLVAVARRTGLVQTCLLADVEQRRHAAEVVGLRFQWRRRVIRLSSLSDTRTHTRTQTCRQRVKSAEVNSIHCSIILEIKLSLTCCCSFPFTGFLESA